MTCPDDDDLALHAARRDDKLAAIASQLNVPVSSFYRGVAADAHGQTEAGFQSEIAELNVIYSDLGADQRGILLAFARRLAVSNP